MLFGRILACIFIQLSLLVVIGNLKLYTPGFRFFKLLPQLRQYTSIIPRGTFYTCNFVLFSEPDEFILHFGHYVYPLFCARILAYGNHNLNTIIDTQSVETFLFIRDLSEFKTELNKFTLTKLFTNEGRYKIVFSHESNTFVNETVIYNLAKIVWQHRIINFIFMYINNVNLQIAQYNPFKDELFIANVTDLDENFVEYPDKMRDMNGYPLKLLGKEQTFYNELDSTVFFIN